MTLKVFSGWSAVFRGDTRPTRIFKHPTRHSCFDDKDILYSTRKGKDVKCAPTSRSTNS